MTTIHIDKGWAWAVPIGGFIANFIVGGLAKSFGIIIQSTQELYDSSIAPLTLAGGLIYTFMYCLSPLGIILCQKFGCKTIMNIGSLGCVISFILAYFAPNVTVWVIVIGGGVGISLGMLYSPIFVMVARCFRKRVGIAMGLSVAGVSIGQMAFPAIISFVIDAYSARGSYLFGAGIVCHFFVTANLMPRYIAEEENAKTTKLNHEKKDCEGNEVEKLPLQDIKNGNVHHSKEKTKEKKQCSFAPIHIVMLVIFVLAKVFGDVGDVGIAFALPPHGAGSLDMNNEQISLAIAVAGGVDLLARILVGITSDQKWCRRSLVLAGAWLLEGLNSFFFIWFPSYTNYFIFYGIFGLTSGTAITLMTLVITDLVGQKNMPISFGIMMFVLGLVISPGQFLVGHLADITGTYEMSLKFLGYCMIIAFLLMILEYPVKSWVFNTKSGVADHKIKANGGNGSVNHPVTEDNLNLIEIVDPKTTKRSHSSSTSSSSRGEAKVIIA